MVEIGRIQTLKVVHIDEKGAWLQVDKKRVLLSQREIPSGTQVGDQLEIFVYPDSSGSPVATTRQPLAQIGEFALLRVRQVTRHGAFLDWGLEKDLLVPFSEQPDRMKEGRKYVVKVCRDNTGRLVGTAKIERCLETEDISLAEGDEVEMMIWQFTELGAKVIINDLYSGLLYKDELWGGLTRGDRLTGYVKRIREDRKIDVTLRKSGAEAVAEAKEVVVEALQALGGFLPLNDRSTPEQIQQMLGLSKKAFKKAVGGLYKAGVIELTDEGIRLKKN